MSDFSRGNFNAWYELIFFPCYIFYFDDGDGDDDGIKDDGEERTVRR